jgi:hypothetical protein
MQFWKCIKLMVKLRNEEVYRRVEEELTSWKTIEKKEPGGLATP